MVKKKGKKLSKTQKIALGIVALVFASMMILLFTPGVKMQMFSTSGGNFDIQLMGVGIKNPYDKLQKVVLFSNDNGNPVLDGTRTTWKSDLTKEHWDYFDYMDKGAVLKPAFIKQIGTGVNYDYGWEYGPREPLNKWNNENNWLSTQGCNIDPDAKNSGVPDLGISIANLYPSDSNGHPDDDFSHGSTTKTLQNINGSIKEVEIVYGFITYQILFSITGDYYKSITDNDKKLEGIVCEQSGRYKDPLANRFWNTLGTQLDFNAVFRIQLMNCLLVMITHLIQNGVILGMGFLKLIKKDSEK